MLSLNRVYTKASHIAEMAVSRLDFLKYFSRDTLTDRGPGPLESVAVDVDIIPL